jgi:hypothetical protein
MLNNQSSAEGAQDSSTDLPTSTSGRVERSSHFRSGSSEAAELHDRGGNFMSRSSWSPSTEVGCSCHLHASACKPNHLSRAHWSEGGADALLHACTGAGRPKQGPGQQDLVRQGAGTPAERPGMHHASPHTHVPVLMPVAVS